MTRSNRLRRVVFLLVLVVVGLGVARRLAIRPPAGGRCVEAPRAPRLTPDYTGIVIPPNIAPLNFVVAEPGRRHRARLTDSCGRVTHLAVRGGVVTFGARWWRALLAANRGQELVLDIWSRQPDGRWTHFAPVRNRVAAEPAEDYLVYRKFIPFYNSAGAIGIYQRDLRSFAETTIVDRDDLNGACMNCHTFGDRRPDRFLLHTRLIPGDPGMVLVQGSSVRQVDTRTGGSGPPAGYSSWHPNGEIIAFSRNRIMQYYPQAGPQAKAALDAASSLVIYTVASGQATTPAVLNPPGRLPTFPCWSPDGRWLYFSSAPALWPPGTFMPVAQQKRLRYDIMRAPFDPATLEFGRPEPVVSAKDTGQSALEPRVSPDGRWLLFCLCEAGTFPVFQARSDLYLLDLSQPGARPVPLEPAATTRRDSWHAWSGNSRWIVCASKRDNDILARPYLRHVAPDGTASKPFVVPQRNPLAYEREPNTYNVPEFVSGPIAVSRADLARAVGGKGRANQPTQSSPSSKAPTPEG